MLIPFLSLRKIILLQAYLFHLLLEKKSRTFIFKTDEIFSFETELLKEVRFIITIGSIFESTLRNYLDYNEELECGFFMNDDTYADIFKLKNSKLKLPR